jgi:lipopolysaccharide export system permease protein
VGSSLGAVVGRGGLGLPTLLALCVFILFYVLSMLGEQMVKSGTLTPVSGMWLSTLLLTPLAVWLFWSTLRERSWMSRWGS